MRRIVLNFAVILSFILVSGLLASPISAVDKTSANATTSTTPNATTSATPNAAKSTASPSKYATKSPEYWKKKAEQRAKKRVERQKRIDKIFQEAKGYEIKFDYEGHEKEREIAYEYYKRIKGLGVECRPEIEEELKSRPITEVFKVLRHELLQCYKLDRKLIGIDMYDVDGDGEDEILVFNKGLVSKGGYGFSVLKKDKSGENSTYKALFGMATSNKIKILDSKTLDMPDILYEYIVWKWNGKKYGLSEFLEKF